MAKVSQFIADSNQRIAQYEAELKKWAAVLPFEQMTMEDFADAFPDQAWNPNKPTWWPHDKDSQVLAPKTDDHH